MPPRRGGRAVLGVPPLEPLPAPPLYPVSSVGFTIQIPAGRHRVQMGAQQLPVIEGKKGLSTN